MARKLTQIFSESRNRINPGLSISWPDVILYGCFAAAILTIFLSWSFITRTVEQYSYERKISGIEERLDLLTTLSQQKQKAESALTSDAPSLSNHLSSIPLLNLEKCALELQKKESCFTEIQERRYKFILDENSFVFQRGKTTDTGAFREAELKLQHTVQIDEDDLQTILQEIDSSPSLRTKKFHLTKEKDFPCYSLHLEIFSKEGK